MTFARLTRIARQRLRSLFRRRAVERDLDRELAFHVDALVAELRARGHSEAEARQQARRVFGCVDTIGEACRETRRLGWLDDFGRDVVYGVRRLRADPGLTAAVVISLALGVGAETAVLRAVDAAAVRRLELPDASRYVAIHEVELDKAPDARGVTAMEFAAWRDHPHLFDRLGASSTSQRTLNGDDGAPPERVSALAVTSGALAAMDVAPILGRDFSADESRLVNPTPAVIISSDLWERRFGRDPNVLARRLRVDGVARAIVGVMSPEMRYEDVPADIWLPLRLIPDRTWGVAHTLRVTGRLAPGVSVPDASAAVTAMSADLARQLPAPFAGWHVVVEPLDRARLGWTRRPLATIGVIATLVLVIAGVNVSGLLLARAAARDRDTRLRLALGAARGRLLRQWLTEGLLLGALGGLASLVATAVGLRAWTLLPAPPGSPRLRPLHLDADTIAIAAVLSLAAGVVFSLGPALTSLTPRPVSRSTGRWRAALVTIQIAVTFGVVVASALLATSVIRLATRDFHFSPAHLLNIDVSIPEQRRQIGSDGGRPLFEAIEPAHDTLARLEDAFRRVPGVVSVGSSTFRAVDAFVVPRPVVTLENGRTFTVATAHVTSGYLETIGGVVVRGRAIAERDDAASAWVAMANETAARRLWPDRDAIGRTVTLDTGPDERPRTIVGVVGDIPLRHAALEAEPILYVVDAQQPRLTRGVGASRNMTMVARFTGDDTAIVSSLRRAAAAVDPTLPLGTIGTATGQLAIGRGELSTLAGVSATLGAIGILLALVGIHGIVAFKVTHATREIAIRRSLGARGWDVLRTISARVTLLVAAGLAGGLALAFAGARSLAPLLWGVSSRDPLTYGLATMLLLLASAVACAGPLRAALSVEPATILRTD